MTAPIRLTVPGRAPIELEVDLTMAETDDVIATVAERIGISPIDCRLADAVTGDPVRPTGLTAGGVFALEYSSDAPDDEEAAGASVVDVGGG